MQTKWARQDQAQVLEMAIQTNSSSGVQPALAQQTPPLQEQTGAAASQPEFQLLPTED